MGWCDVLIEMFQFRHLSFQKLGVMVMSDILKTLYEVEWLEDEINNTLEIKVWPRKPCRKLCDICNIASCILL